MIKIAFFLILVTIPVCTNAQIKNVTENSNGSFYVELESSKSKTISPNRGAYMVGYNSQYIVCYGEGEQEKNNGFIYIYRANGAGVDFYKRIWLCTPQDRCKVNAVTMTRINCSMAGKDGRNTRNVAYDFEGNVVR